ncbi:MAG: SIS domain-containing protein, partial [Chloroflexota bacterium]
MSGPLEPAGRRYLRTVTDLIARLLDQEWPRIAAAADLMTDAIASGHVIHAFGSGHSHMLAEELFYRAGGLVRVRPILFEGLMLHASAPLSTTLERMPGLAAILLSDHPIDAGDVLILGSNSGSNAVTTELASLARAAGARTIGVTSLRHATSGSARVHDGRRLHELVDVAIDNGGAVGDAAVEVEGLGARVAPTSTVVGAAILEALVAETVERLVARGVVPEVYA